MFAETAFITKIIKHPPMKTPTGTADIKFHTTATGKKFNLLFRKNN